MANPLNNVTVGDDYSDPATISEIWGGRGGSFLVKNAAVVVSMQYGRLGESFWTSDQRLEPGGGQIEAGVVGIKFKNAASGQTASVDASIAPPGQPIIGLGFQGTAASTLLTGSFNAAGAIGQGTGFTVTPLGGGAYQVNFVVAFNAAPAIVANVDSNVGNVAVLVQSRTAAQCVLATGNGLNEPIVFVATGMV